LSDVQSDTVFELPDSGVTKLPDSREDTPQGSPTKGVTEPANGKSTVDELSTPKSAVTVQKSGK